MRFLSLVLGVCLVSAASFLLAAEPPKVVTAEVTGQVVDQQGKPAPGVSIRSIAYDAVAATKTDVDGNFTVDVDEKRLRQLAIVATDTAGNRMGLFNANYKDLPKQISISLETCSELPVEVTDADGTPCEAAIVGALIESRAVATAVTDTQGNATLRWPASYTPEMLYTCKPQVGFDYRVVSTPRDPAHQAEWFEKPPVRLQLAPAQTVAIRLVDRQNQPVPGVRVYPWYLMKKGEPDSFNLGYTPWFFTDQTNQDGIATFQGLPTWNVLSIPFWPAAEGFVRTRIEYDLKQHPDGLKTVVIDRLVPVGGVVQDIKGNPLEGATVLARGANFTHDRPRDETTTDKSGKFQFSLPPDTLYAFAVQDEKWGSPLIEGIVVQPNEPIDDLLLTARTATRISGRVTIGPDNEPVIKQRIMLTQETQSASDFPDKPLPNPDESTYWVAPSFQFMQSTDDDGRFEFFTGPGKYTLSAGTQVDAAKFEVFAQPELQFNFHIPRKEAGPVSGQVVTGDPAQPVANSIVEGKYRAFLSRIDARFRTDEQGQFSGERQLQRTVWYAKSEDGKLAGIVETGPDDKTVTIPIAPVASVTGRFVDRETKAPKAGQKVLWGRNVRRGDDDAPWERSWGGSTVTDEDGRFTATGLVVGQEYSFTYPSGKSSFGRLPPFTPLEPGEHALGDLSPPPRR